MNIEGLNEKTSAYRESGKAEAYKQKMAKIEEMKKTADSKPKSIPHAIALADGAVKHYADADSDIAIARTGDTFLVYDFKTDNVTRNMTRAEVNAELARYRQSKSASTVQNDASAVQPSVTSETANATTENLISEKFNAELQEWFERTTSEERAKSGRRFNLGSTSTVLKSIGVRECEIYFGGSKINIILDGNSTKN